MEDAQEKTRQRTEAKIAEAEHVDIPVGRNLRSQQLKERPKESQPEEEQALQEQQRKQNEEERWQRNPLRGVHAHSRSHSRFWEYESPWRQGLRLSCFICIFVPTVAFYYAFLQMLPSNPILAFLGCAEVSGLLLFEAWHQALYRSYALLAFLFLLANLASFFLRGS